MNKKAQSAMEFLMTYGWAILAVIATISVLAYFGVTNYNKLTPEMCILSPGMGCIDSTVTTDTISMMLINSLGKDININNITVGNCAAIFNQDLDNGDDSIFVISGCSNGLSGTRFSELIQIKYMAKQSSLTKFHRGKLLKLIQ